MPIVQDKSHRDLKLTLHIPRSTERTTRCLRLICPLMIAFLVLVYLGIFIIMYRGNSADEERGSGNGLISGNAVDIVERNREHERHSGDDYSSGSGPVDDAHGRVDRGVGDDNDSDDGDDNGGSDQVAKDKKKRKLLVGVVDEHNDVLHYWIQAYLDGSLDQRPLPLLHFDSHSDAAIPLGAYEFPRVDVEEQKASINIKEIREWTSIGDFIPAAQWMSIVSEQVVWVKPNWPDQQFNFYPGPPHFGTLLKRRQHSLEPNTQNKTQSFLCLADAESDESRDSLDGIAGNQCICDNPDDQDRTREIRVRWDVLHDNQKGDLSTLIPSGSPYILDIDLDYFASMSATVFQTFRSDIYGVLFRSLEEHVGDYVMCYGKDPTRERANRRRVTKLLRAMFWRGLSFLPGSREEDGPLLLRRFGTARHPTENLFDSDVLDLWCDGRNVAWNSLIQLSKLVHVFFEKVDYFRLYQLHSDNKFPDVSCRTNEFFAVCVSHGDPMNYNPSRSEVRRAMIGMRDMLQLVGPPQLVTIARSLDGYTPAHMFPFIEQQVIEALREAFHEVVDIEVEYLQGVPPTPLPEPDEKIAFEQSPLRQVNMTLLQSIHRMLSNDEDMGSFVTASQWISADRWTAVKVRNVFLLREYMMLHGTDLEDFMRSHFQNFKAWKRVKLAKIRRQEIAAMKKNKAALEERMISSPSSSLPSEDD